VLIYRPRLSKGPGELANVFCLGGSEIFGGNIFERSSFGGHQLRFRGGGASLRTWCCC
jgi:hypothetical protein